MLLSRNLSWSDHISELCTKVRRILGLLYRQFYDNVDPATLQQLYISLVRPHLEYASQVWDPYPNGDIDRLEAVQKFALKLIRQQWDLGYEELLTITDVPKLGEWRLQLKLAQVFKIVHGLCYFPRMSSSHNPLTPVGSQDQTLYYAHWLEFPLLCAKLDESVELSE